MVYHSEQVWENWERQARIHCQQLVELANRGNELHETWTDFKAGESNADIATRLKAPATATYVADLDSAIEVFNQLEKFMSNVSVAQIDRFTKVRKFVP